MEHEKARGRNRNSGRHTRSQNEKASETPGLFFAGLETEGGNGRGQGSRRTGRHGRGRGRNTQQNADAPAASCSGANIDKGKRQVRPEEAPGTDGNVCDVPETDAEHASELTADEEQRFAADADSTDAPDGPSSQELHLQLPPNPRGWLAADLADLKTTEGDLSVEEREQNWQTQIDEVVALQSIFGEDFHGEDAISQAENAQQGTFDSSDQHALTFEVTVHVELPGEAAVLGGGGMELMSLKHLTPLRLACALPPSCPSRSPPLFYLICLWLRPAQLSAICRSMSAAWLEECAEQAVGVYTLVEQMRSAAVAALGLPCQVDLLRHVGIGRSTSGAGELAACGGESIPTSDLRGIPSHLPFHDTLMALIGFNEMKTLRVFKEGIHTCLICFEEFMGHAFVYLPGCRHAFCGGCMKGCLGLHVEEGALSHLRCPDPTCKLPLPHQVLREVLDDAQFQRWERLTLERTLDCMIDLVYCPRCDAAVVEDEDHLAECSQCFLNFCSLCREPWHTGRQCLDPDAKLRLLQERMKGRSGADEWLKGRMKKEQELISELKSQSLIQKCSKQCPACKMAIEKSEGCNKMTCGNCGAYFCYRCGKLISGYEHFREGECVLFEWQDIQDFNARMAGQHAQVHIDLQMQRRNPVLRVNLTRCPNCGQQNLKEQQNNHIACWACNMHFCFLCRDVIKGTGHFSRQGCKQHSN